MREPTDSAVARDQADGLTRSPHRQSIELPAPPGWAATPKTAEALDDGPVPGSRKTPPPLRRILVGTDLIMVAVGWSVALAVSFVVGNVVFGPLTALAQVAMMLASGWFLLSTNGLYRRYVCSIRSVELARIGRVSLTLGVVTVVVLASTGREAALLAGVLGSLCWFLALSLERSVLREWIQGRRATGDFGASVLVVGGDTAATLETACFLAENPVLGFQVKGVAYLPMTACDTADFARFDISGDPNDLCNEMERAGARGVVLDAGSLTGRELNTLVQRLETAGLHIHISSGLRGIDARRISVSPIADETFLHVAPSGLSKRQVILKRGVDVVGATTALLLLSPLLLLSGLLIRFEDRGPMLFRQLRVGRNGKTFTLYKLRTMVMDAERRRAELTVSNKRSGPLFKLDHDPRVTRSGRLLRASSIDEIPQLFNVLEGTMSLVGPRPALPDEVEQFDEELSARVTVKPGLTGLWQVEARDLPSFDLYRRYDLLYVQNWSLGVDLAVIARTIIVVGLRAIRAALPARFRASEIVE